MDVKQYHKEVIRIKGEIRLLEIRRKELDATLSKEHAGWIETIKERDKKSKNMRKEQDGISANLKSALKNAQRKNGDLEVLYESVRSEKEMASLSTKQNEALLDKEIKKCRELQDALEEELRNVENEKTIVTCAHNDTEKINKRLSKKIDDVENKYKEINFREAKLAASEKRVDRVEIALVDRSNALVDQKKEADRIDIAHSKRSDELTVREEAVKGAEEAILEDKKVLKALNLKLKVVDEEQKEKENNLTRWNQKLIKRDQLRQNAE